MTRLPDNLHAYCAVHNHTVMSWVPAANRDTDRFGTRNVAVDAKYWYALRFPFRPHGRLRRLGRPLLPEPACAVGARPRAAGAERQPAVLRCRRRAPHREPDSLPPGTRVRRPLPEHRALVRAADRGRDPFFDHFLSELRRTCEWEQSLFNRALHGRVRGSSWWRAMNYSVLSKQHYANVDVFEERVGFNCSNDLVAIHMGYVSQADKVSRLRGSSLRAWGCIADGGAETSLRNFIFFFFSRALERLEMRKRLDDLLAPLHVVLNGEGGAHAGADGAPLLLAASGCAGSASA